MLVDVATQKQGAREYSKVSYPIRYGIYNEVRTDDYIFQFNMLGEIRYIRGRKPDWPHPAEWLKRTWGGDWVYYSSGDYRAVFDYFGEYYFPCLAYGNNSIMGDNPFSYGGVQRAFRALESLWREAGSLGSRGTETRAFLARMAEHNGTRLARRGRAFHKLLGGQVSVLPPDARHADYDVIPLILADGCLYSCSFCTVKSGNRIALRSRTNVLDQIERLKRFYGTEVRNYNALFLGYHDALFSGSEMIEFAVRTAYEAFGFERSYMKRPTLHLFGSVDSLLSSKESLFEMLNSVPFHTYINVGLESADPATLSILGKPVPAEKIRDAYERTLDISGKYEKIEVSANFVVGLGLPPSHGDSFFRLTCKSPRSAGGGSIYVSPIVNTEKPTRQEQRQLRAEFSRFKTGASLPTYLYLIQRL
jgi:hypothetical protein